MKLFTKSLFLITLGFNSFFIKDSGASSAFTLTRAMEEAEQTRIQQQQKEAHRAEKIANIQNRIEDAINKRIDAMEQRIEALEKKNYKMLIAEAVTLGAIGGVFFMAIKHRK